MIPSFKKYLKESVWMDIHKQSNGDMDRNENNVDLLDFEGLYDYIDNNYYIDNEDTLSVYFHGPERVGISVCFQQVNDEKGHCYAFYVEYATNPENNETKIWFYQFLEKMWGDIIKKLKDKFVVEYNDHNIFNETSDIISILPKSGKIDNKFFLELIDFISDNINNSYIKKS